MTTKTLRIALAAAHVEHPARGHPGDLGQQRAVGPAAPQPVAPRAVPLVPLRLLRGIADEALGGEGGLWSCCAGHRSTVAGTGRLLHPRCRSGKRPPVALASGP